MPAFVGGIYCTSARQQNADRTEICFHYIARTEGKRLATVDYYFFDILFGTSPKKIVRKYDVFVYLLHNPPKVYQMIQNYYYYTIVREKNQVANVINVCLI